MHNGKYKYSKLYIPPTAFHLLPAQQEPTPRKKVYRLIKNVRRIFCKKKKSWVVWTVAEKCQHRQQDKCAFYRKIMIEWRSKCFTESKKNKHFTDRNKKRQLREQEK